MAGTIRDIKLIIWMILCSKILLITVLILTAAITLWSSIAEKNQTRTSFSEHYDLVVKAFYPWGYSYNINVIYSFSKNAS